MDYDMESKVEHTSIIKKNRQVTDDELITTNTIYLISLR